jgi:hypothetical protein
MICYFDPNNAPLRDVPQRLLPKAVQQFGEAAEFYGLKPVPTPGLPSDAIRLDTRGVRSSAQLQEWLVNNNVTVVDLEPSDLACAFDHKMSAEALGALRHFPTEHLSQLEPADIPDAIRALAFPYPGSFNHDAILDDSDLGRIMEEDIAKDLRRAGLDVPESSHLEQWQQMQVEKPREHSAEFADAQVNPFALESSEFGA